MRTIRKHGKKRAGSIVLEAAITVPVVVVLMLSMLSSMTVVNADLCVHRATENVIQGINVAIPFAASGFNCLDEVTAALGIGDLFDVDMKGVDEVLGIFGSIAGATGVELEDVLTTALFGRYVRDRILVEYGKLSDGSPIAKELMGDMSVYLDYCGDANCVLVKVFYKLKMGTFQSSRQYISTISIYAENITLGAPSEDKKPDDDIWEKDNFSRGTAFREMYGGNLPFNYPVISGFSDGKATMIKSIDTTSPYYGDIAVLNKVLKGYIDDLAGFDGAKWGETVISPGDIHSKELIVVIPENGDASCKMAIEEMRSYAQEKGIVLRIETYGVSNKYISDPSESTD